MGDFTRQKYLRGVEKMLTRHKLQLLKNKSSVRPGTSLQVLSFIVVNTENRRKTYNEGNCRSLSKFAKIRNEFYAKAQTAKADTLHVDNDTSDEKEIAQRNATFKACRRKLHKAIRARE